MINLTATESNHFFIGRALVGVASGPISGLALALATDLYSGTQRRLFLACIAYTFPVTTIIGIPSLLWMQTHWGSQSIYKVLFVVHMITLLLAAKSMPEAIAVSTRQGSVVVETLEEVHIDYLGLFLSNGSTIALMMAFFLVIPELPGVLIRQHGITPGEIRTIYQLAGGLSLASSIVATRYHRVVSHHRVLWLGAMLYFLAIHELMNTSLSSHIVLPAFFVCYTLMNLSLINIASQLFPIHIQGAWFSVRGVLLNVASATGAALGSYAMTMSYNTSSLPFSFNAALGSGFMLIALVTGLLSLLRIRS